MSFKPTTAPDDLIPILEAMLFAAHESLSLKRLARALEGVSPERIEAGIARLQARFDETGSPLMLAQIAGGYRVVTRPEYAPFLARLFTRAERDRLSPAALETLAIVAYRQPATRAEIEAVRGVQAGPVLKVLQDRRLIRMVGRAEIVGRPMQYGTTRRFLDLFGLSSLDELPQVFSRGCARAEAEPAAANGNGAVHANGHAGAPATNGHAVAPSPA
jgi:segregation and condensation protein B